MHLVIIILNKEEFLDEILEALVEVGITGATIIDSIGMGKTLAYNIPIFAGLQKSIKTSDYNKMIFSLVQDDQTLNKIISLIDGIIDFDVPGTGILFVAPVSLFKGMHLEELSW